MRDGLLKHGVLKERDGSREIQVGDVGIYWQVMRLERWARDSFVESFTNYIMKVGNHSVNIGEPRMDGT